ncbi:PepSY-associated TM helix domain-containing protein [Zhongshania arctica]|uniref:PepSY-associated TM helix domain-containing protein n=1 Tax=Zhongshania arctica TaxID=3238302 RepID=A0ABV3TUC5_9GAMM
MSRKLFVSIHLYLAAFFSPIVIIMAVSGGLYLLDYKGETSRTVLGQITGARLDADSETLEADVAALLASLNIETRVEEVRARGDSFNTRPSSRVNYTLRQTDTGVEVEELNPNLQAIMMELHKGHGPAIYVVLQRIFALGLVLIMLSGLYLGWMSPMYRGKTLLLSGLGVLVFFSLVLI